MYKMFENDFTRSICIYTLIAMFISLLVIVSPLSNFRKTSMFIKCVILSLILYLGFMSIKQIDYLQNNLKQTILQDITQQLNMNITCSYVFLLFLGLFFLFVLKSFF